MLKYTKLAIVVFGAISLVACDDNNESSALTSEADSALEYQVTVSNLTNAQPFSPLTVLLHDTGDVWNIGDSASDALESLAESGDNSTLMSSSFVLGAETNGAVLPYGQSATVTISTETESNYLSLVTMLVNTNDAFSGLNKVDISQLAVNQSLQYSPGAYDAGTEGNSEAAGTIPGPADGGEGFNASRDDLNIVTMHSGIISSDDGLVGSVLNFEHKFDNPVMAVTITRIK
ncbi:hypothetical protein GCM10007916_04280 [Psychromonas marina]|uniref:Spondin domain-containing protein n=1 Tax=Psychromonas marina TaxID=88364 RepID=A0ABQ6DW63_9GAMM|nr:spondin domain-containing protein [Psychromonas marina]GLS89361.1 hypothetical protein GCM10007916_04280 [Psychromonas marina]